MATPIANPEVKSFFDPRTATGSYLIWDPATRRGAVIDAVLDLDSKSGRVWTESADRLLAAAAELGVAIDWVLETHAHADHLSGAQYVKEKTGARLAIGSRIREVQTGFKPIFGADDVMTDGSAFDRLLNDGETIEIGRLTVTAMHTPGHTPACATYLIGEHAFVGDTLFMPDYGTARADFPGGDARTLYRSIRRILDLPANTRIHVGHDYPSGAGRREPRLVTTVAEERAQNPHVHDGVSEDEFVAMRSARDATLEAPNLLLPSLQVNIRAGHLPPPDDDGRTYLKLPLKVETSAAL
jgi:glyoxylase-like metal-dependent hydrolase (beta-lactamase superfamily II)